MKWYGLDMFVQVATEAGEKIAIAQSMECSIGFRGENEKFTKRPSLKETLVRQGQQPGLAVAEVDCNSQVISYYEDKKHMTRWS